MPQGEMFAGVVLLIVGVLLACGATLYFMGGWGVVKFGAVFITGVVLAILVAVWLAVRYGWLAR